MPVNKFKAIIKLILLFGKGILPLYELESSYGKQLDIHYRIKYNFVAEERVFIIRERLKKMESVM